MYHSFPRFVRQIALASARPRELWPPHGSRIGALDVNITYSWHVSFTIKRPYPPKSILHSFILGSIQHGDSQLR